MERVIEERRVDGHHVVVLEEITDEGSAFGLVIDGVPAPATDRSEPLGRPPTDEEIRALLRSRRAP